MSTIDTTAYNSSLSNITDSYVDPTAEENDGSVLGQEDFLTLLVAQMENQDPLNPMESTEYTAQLAQFSSLEQQITTNDYLAEISEKFDTESEDQLIDYIGKAIVTSACALEVSDGNALSVSYSLGESGKAEMIIYNASGEEVRRIDLGSKEEGSHEVSWDGRDNEGNIVSDGVYSYNILATDENGYASEVDTSETGVVDGIIFQDGVAYLKVNGNLVAPDAVVEVSAQAT